MRTFFRNLFLLLFTLSSLSLAAQITIDANDFADAGDTLRMSEAVWNPLLDYGATGANYNWNFSDLQWQNQFVDEYLNPIFINPIYSFVFSDLPFNPNRSNLAKPADNTLTTLPIVSSVFTEPYNFYYKSTSMYRQRGIGMKVSGFPTSIPMKHADTLYHFPMLYGNIDSARSDYTVQIPQLGTYAHRQKRTNEVDGWGSLTTPYGTFDVLRVRTEILGSDSLYIDTLNFGINLNNDIQREYKWFAKNEKVPLLQINTQAGIFGQFQNFEFVTKIVYRDSVRFLPTGIFVQQNELPLQVFPNPSNGVFHVSVPANVTNATIMLTDLSGKLLLQQPLNKGVETIDATVLAKGVYLITVQSNEGKAQQKLVVQ